MSELPSGLTSDLAATVLKQGEVRLAAQLQIALAADSRATTFASILIAVAAILLGFGGDQATGKTPDFPLAIGALGAGILLLISAAICVTAARPIKFDLAGAVPENWWDDGVTNRSHEESLWQESNNYTRRIRENGRRLRKNAQLFRVGMYLACASPIIGFGLWVFSRLCL